MSIETAEFLVQRAGVQLKCTGAELSTKLQEDDLMAVTRQGDDTYKWVVALPPVGPFTMRIDTRLKFSSSTTSDTYTDITLTELGGWSNKVSTLDVDWGDGIIQTLTSADAGNVTHNYAVPGEYVITTGLSGYSKPGCTYKPRILEMTGNDEGSYAFGTKTASSSLNSIFTGSTNLTEASSDTFDWSNVASAGSAYYNCEKLVTFEGANFTSTLTLVSSMFKECEKLETVGSLGDTSSVTNFQFMFQKCESLLVAPDLDTSSANDMSSMFDGCEALTVAPVYDISNNPNLGSMFNGCEALTSTAIGYDFSNHTNQMMSYQSCTNLTDVPPNIVDGCPNAFLYMFNFCALTVQSVENFLVSADSCGLSNGGIGMNGTTNASKATWTAAANTAYDNLISRGYTIYFNP